MRGGSIRDGVLLDLIDFRLGARMPSEPEPRLWDCDSDTVLAAMSVETEAQVAPSRFD